ncbi:MAG: lipopolysaccharide assembly protein LapA domain-containing protein [Armatimonadota bacterium]
MAALFFMLLLAFIVIIFSIQNADPMSLKFMIWHFSLPKVVVLFLSLLTGVIIAVLLAVYNSSVSKKAVKELKVKLSEKESKIRELEGRPVKEEE